VPAVNPDVSEGIQPAFHVLVPCSSLSLFIPVSALLDASDVVVAAVRDARFRTEPAYNLRHIRMGGHWMRGVTASREVTGRRSRI
jgi:hypothetical protein